MTAAMTVATGAMTAKMTVVTGAMTARTAVPDPDCCGDSPRTRSAVDSTVQLSASVGPERDSAFLRSRTGRR